MRIPLLFSFLFAATLAVAAADPASHSSVLPNGNFELDSKGAGWPDGWGKGPTPGISWELESGKHFMRLVSQSPGQMVMLYRTVPLPAGTKGIEVTMRYRTAGVKRGAQAWFDARSIFHFLDSERKQVTPAPKAIVFSGKAAQWTEASQRVVVPEGAVQLEMMPALFKAAAGTLDLAEIRVEAMSDADLAAMAASTAEAEKKKADRAAAVERDLAMPSITPELKVSGNQLVTADGKPVWLQGLSVDSMQWSMGENILWSIRVAFNDWKSNVIRLPVLETYWFGKGKNQKPGSEQEYRELVDKAVKLVAAKGGYLVLDLHRFGAPTEEHVAFWKDAATRYKNNPAVLFELFNEPHGLSWEIWRDGGSLNSPKNKSTDVNPIENNEKQTSNVTPGMQALVDAVRATGAKNIIVAGGLDWAYDLSGIMKGYALKESDGNGIMYVSHIYPWKKDWQKKVLVAVDKYPIIITEIGCPPDYKGFQFIPEKGRFPLEGWAEDVLGLIQKHKLNWTGFSFNPHCGPMVIKDWDYTPTPYWGVYVKQALAGKQFQMKKMR